MRRNPVSRRYGFHAATLSRSLGLLGLHYVGCPELGISSDERRTATDPEALRHLLAAYERSVGPECRGRATEVGVAMSNRPLALMCLETDPDECHRSALARLLSAAFGLPVRHLGGP